MPQDFVASAILDSIRKLPGYPNLSVLDLSCGRGEILSAIVKDGCTARGTHYRSDDYKLTQQTTPLFTGGLQIDDGVDLMKPIPYESQSFDLVILSEVIEHLESFIPIIREIGRVLRPGGHFVMSTPNIARLHSRLDFFLTGTHKLIRRRVGWDLSPDDLYAYHINPVDFPFFHTLLYQAGLEIRAINFTNFKVRHAWLLLAYPLFWLATQLGTRERVTSEAHRRGERDLRRWMLSPAMLASEQLLVVATKSRTLPG
ncbi:MAG: class I SAM-dependent methyltransferase [Acidobacteria bacterium]|nr:class I SAM-dependent methyltransferase [Acidobacteriota bacterium]